MPPHEKNISKTKNEHTFKKGEGSRKVAPVSSICLFQQIVQHVKVLTKSTSPNINAVAYERIIDL